MFTTEIVTDNPQVRLIKPDIDRDAQTSVDWINGESGRITMELMGNAPDSYSPTNLEAEQNRIRDFIEKEDQLNWAIAYDEQVVGAIWVDLLAKGSVRAPSIHIMIGDTGMRGKGVGTAAFRAVMRWLQTEHDDTALYTRHLAANEGAGKLIYNLGFTDDGETYTDEDGLVWQNAKYVRTND